MIALAGNGTGFCGGYDLTAAEDMGSGRAADGARQAEAPRTDAPAVVAANHDPAATWDPVVDWQMMSRNLRGFMSLFHSDKPVICKIHGYCIAGGTDMALCSDLIVTEDRAKIGYPPARVWGVPTSMLWAHRIGLERARRLLLTGDSIDGTTAVEWGLASEAAPHRRARRMLRGAARAGRAPAGQPARHAQARDQRPADEPGALRKPDDERLLRRDRPPHAGGLRVSASGGRGRVQGGGAPARRAVRRPRTLMNQVSAAPDILSNISALSSSMWAYTSLSAAFELGVVKAAGDPGDGRRAERAASTSSPS